MSTVFGERSPARAEWKGALPWAAILLGLLALYVPTYLDLSRGLWKDEAYAHGPIIVAVFAWLVWRARAVLADETAEPAPLAGGALIFAGLALYLLGRTQGLAVFEVASHIPVITGAVLLMRGAEGVRRLAFPLFFLVFLVPLPGFVLDIVTVPLKEIVSRAVEFLLVIARYPVEREGVVLWMGDHSMLVADACSGLNSLYSLFALGMLYSHVTGGMRKAGSARVILLLLAIIPIAIAANIVRVLALVLVTYHFGEEAAQGLLHDFAGLIVFGVAFGLLIAWDSLVRRLLAREGGEARREVQFDGTGVPRLSQRNPTASRYFARLGIVAGLAMAATAAAAPALKPQPDPAPAPDLEVVLPAAFGDWRIDPEMVQVAPTPDVQANLDRLYNQIVSRTYVNSAGDLMMLTIAYGGDQSDALKAHRQEACYAAQGFEIRALERGYLTTAGRDIPVTRMMAVRGERFEPVTYWFTMGDRVVMGRFERLRVQLENGLAGRIPDGMLVRVSSLSTDARGAYAAQKSFIAEAVKALPPQHVSRFVGAPR